MAFDVSVLSTYIDDNKFGLLTQLQSTAGLAGVVRMVPKIKSASNVHFLGNSVVFQDDTCSYNSSGTTPLTEKVLQTGAIAIMESICVKDLNGKWLETQVRQGAAGEEAIPEMVAKAWVEKRLNGINRALTIADFQGDITSPTANLQKYDGLLKLVDADGTVVDGNVNGVNVATGITAANVISILQGMFTSRPEELRGENDNVSLWLGQEIYDLYKIALINANLFSYIPENQNDRLFGTNVVLRPTVGLNGTNRLLMFDNENVIVGMDGAQDADNLDIWYSKDDREHKSLVALKRGIQFGFGNEIVEFTLVP